MDSQVLPVHGGMHLGGVAVCLFPDQFSSFSSICNISESSEVVRWGSLNFLLLQSHSRSSHQVVDSKSLLEDSKSMRSWNVSASLLCSPTLKSEQRVSLMKNTTGQNTELGAFLYISKRSAVMLIV